MFFYVFFCRDNLKVIAAEKTSRTDGRTDRRTDRQDKNIYASSLLGGSIIILDLCYVNLCKLRKGFNGSDFYSLTAKTCKGGLQNRTFTQKSKIKISEEGPAVVHKCS